MSKSELALVPKAGDDELVDQACVLFILSSAATSHIHRSKHYLMKFLLRTITC